jgi:hypothetical protein
MDLTPQEVARQQRIIAAYLTPVEKEKKKDEPIESLEQIIEERPTPKKVRAYYASVLENIQEAEAESFLH